MSSPNFLQECKNNNPGFLIDCLSRGVDVNTVSEDGRWSGLTIAAQYNYPELLEILLSHHHIKVNNTTKVTLKINDTTNRENQWTALMVACNAGNPAIVSRLVQVPGLDINYQDESGGTAALWACINGRTECVRILAETGRVVHLHVEVRGLFRGAATPAVLCHKEQTQESNNRTFSCMGANYPYAIKNQ